MLGTPPAFVLSQDQTLKKLYLERRSASNHFLNKFVLANITQEFRWLLISILHRLNNPLIVQGVN